MRKTRRGKALEITKEVKETVWERDNHRSIISGSPYAFPEAHYIPRSKGGMGIEQNIVTLTREEHYKFDYGTKEEQEWFGSQIKEYLQNYYPDWDENNLIYRKD